MFKIINQSGHTAHGLKEYVCDIEQDISNLSIDDTPGSTAFVIASKKTYMLNNQHQWIDITVSFNSNSSGSTSTEFIDYTENFNELKEKVATLITDNTVLKTQINDLTAHNQVLNENINALSEENKNLISNVDILLAKNENLENNINVLSENNNILTNKIETLITNNTSLTDTINVLVEKINLLQAEIEPLRNSHENDNDQDGGEIVLNGTMNMDNIPVEINENTNTLIVDTENSEIKGNTLILK